MGEHAVFMISVIGLLAILCQWIAWRVRLPAILFLLAAGVIVGPMLQWLDPDALFGDLLLPIVSLSVAVILFEGSLTLRLEEIRDAQRVVRRLVSSGLLITWAISTLFTHWLLDFSWELAFLFGALSVVTGPTVIMPLLRSVRPNARIANILRWEGILIDPIGALLAVLVFEFIISGEFSMAFEHTLILFGSTVLTGMTLGIAAAYMLGTLLRRYLLPEFLHNVATLSLVFAVFALSNSIRPESGLLAVTVMGLWLANMKGVHLKDILNFKESLSVLLISGLFIILAARINLQTVQALGLGAIGVLLAIQFIARPLKIMMATFGSSIRWQERVFLSWVAPRGIVAAAVSALFAIRLQEMGFDKADLLVPLMFLIIIGTVVLQSATARPLARWLQVAEPDPKGFLIIGADPLARMIAKALDKKNFRTLLIDRNWTGIRAALMDGLNTYYGSAASDHADRYLDLVGIGSLLALSPQRDVNALAAMRFRSEFGQDAIYTLRVDMDAEGGTQKRESTPRVGHTLFATDITHGKLAAMVSEGARIHDTKLSEVFDFHDYYRKYFRRAVPLFAIDPKERLHIFTADRELTPGTGWTILALILPEQQKDSLKDAKTALREGAERENCNGETKK